MTDGPPRIRRLPTTSLSADDTRAIRAMLVKAFADDGPDEQFDEHDWQHALGGTHVVLDVDGEILAHASVVERWLHVGGMPIRTGYVEAVATAPHRQGNGLGTLVMTEIGDIIRAGFDLGALGTGAHHFYERLGWRTWRGPTSVRTPQGDRPTADDDGFILVLETPTSPPLDFTAPISCDWRPGDVW
jgi:aminoglycoside 2'-N-acetyltransferase I